MTHIMFKADDVLFREGDTSDRVLHINTGEIEIFASSVRASVVLGYVHGGEWVGEMGVMERRPRSATARAVRDGTADLLTVQEFLDRVAGDPRVARELLVRLSIRLRETEDKIAEGLIKAAQTQFGEKIGDMIRPLNTKIVLTARTEVLRRRIGSEAIAITHFPYVVGRKPKLREREPPRHPDLVIEDHEPFRLSRNHFMIAHDDNGLMVCDLGSTLGTMVNGIPIGQDFMRDVASLHGGNNHILAGGSGSPIEFDVSVATRA